MARPKGMRKVDGIWYLPNGTVAPSSQSKATRVNNVEGTQDTTMAPIVPEKPAQSVTEVREDTASPIATVEVANTVVKVQGVHMYTPDEIVRIEQQTGQKFAGNFAEQDSGMLVPVFLRADHSEEERKAKLTAIRRGF